MKVWSAMALMFVLACGKQQWDLDKPIYVSVVSWNLPEPQDYVDGVKTAITALGGDPRTDIPPDGAQILKIWDNSAGSGLCDNDGNILGFADDQGVHICHNPAVFQWAFHTPEKAAFGAHITSIHEVLHLGGHSWHWECTALSQIGEPQRIMGSARACELLEAPSTRDIDYACTGGQFVGGKCRDWQPLPDDGVKKILLDGTVVGY